MSVKRIGTTARWSDAVIHNNTVYLVEVPSNLDGNISEQAKNLLSSVESRLLELGSNKSNILMVTIYLSSINHIGAFNEIWDAWLPAGTAPVRACIEARLANPTYLVEIQLTAALGPSRIN